MKARRISVVLLLIVLFMATMALPAGHAGAIPTGQDPPAMPTPQQVQAVDIYPVPQSVYFVPSGTDMLVSDQELAAYQIEVVSSQRALSAFVVANPKTALILLNPDAFELVDSGWLAEQYASGRIIAGIDIPVGVLSKKADAYLPPGGWIKTVPPDGHVFSYIQRLATASGHDRVAVSDFAWGDDWFPVWMDIVSRHYQKNIVDPGLDALIGAPPSSSVLSQWKALRWEMEAQFGPEIGPSRSPDEGGGGPGCSNSSSGQ